MRKLCIGMAGAALGIMLALALIMFVMGFKQEAWMMGIIANSFIALRMAK